MDIFGVAYVSRATRLMSVEDIDHLLVAARTNNATTGVTGVLLFGDGCFFQYFEGDRAGVAHVYERIRDSSLHTELVELEYQRIPRRLFRRWFMGFREEPASLMQTLSQLQWTRELPWVEDHASASVGMEHLLSFLGPDADRD